ncbi:TetR/AcrR family transcriptional regulator [Roseococcus sp. SYP-B2431]|uniref:TetR/AcrR family transcriptional regulator n=1 Tax=Roseococcus sp. SYP-B2431 TaxID=2496640 RepID=UPI0013F481E0|nr:TetR/AcrR family transcriptional regulator [Roseococcus sp. SYP-B2431]
MKAGLAGLPPSGAPAAGIPAAGVPAAGPRPRLPEAERRQAILRVAESVFLAQGYAATNMDDVARGARMSKKTLYQLFSSKEALFEAVMTEHLAPLLVATPEEAEDDLRKGLIALLDRAATHLLDERHAGFFRLISAEVKRTPELAEAFHRAGPARGKGALERYLAAQAARGNLRLEDPEEAAGMLFGLAIGEPHMRMILAQRHAPGPEEISARVARAVDIFLNGTLPG